MKKILTLTLLFFSTCNFAQLSEVKFREETFANGMNYPQVIIPANKAHEDSINADFRRRIADLEASDFCIGQYGYVQKSTHLQIHLFCNCIDFSESQNRYFLYNLEEGRAVPYSDLLNPKEKGPASEYILGKVRGFATEKGIALPEEAVQSISDQTLDAFKVEMTKDGIKVWMPDVQGWGEQPLNMTWIELKPFLKYHFI